MSGKAAERGFKRTTGTGWLFLLALLLGASGGLAANTQIKLSAATGWQALEKHQAQSLTQFGLSLKTRQHFDKYFVYARGRLTPEFFGSGAEAASAIKISAALSLGMNTAQGRWQAYLSDKKYFYSLSTDTDISFDLLAGGLSFTKAQGRGRQWSLALNYWSRQNQTRPGAQLNAVQFSGGGSRLLGAVRISYRLVSEYFTVHPRYDEIERRVNCGVRIGPYAAWSFRRRFLIRGSLFYMYHYSQLRNKAAGEWGGELVLGKTFGKRWSAFLYGRYQYVNSFPRELPASLLYAPANLENWLYSKITVDIHRRWELFLKSGWLKDDLPATDNRLESTYAVIGLQWHR